MVASACVGDDATASETRSKASSGADLDGWSVLPLLGSERAADGRWLFVSTPSTAAISQGSVADAQFVALPGNYTDRWPFDDGTLAGVVLDGDSLGRGQEQSTHGRMLAEAVRVCGSTEDVLVACTHRRVPRRLHAWREYGRQTAALWNRAARNNGVLFAPAAYLRFDGARLSGIAPVTTELQPAFGHDADRVVLRADRSSRSVLDVMLDQAAASCGVQFRVERISVRKIGKTAIFLTGTDARRYVMRVARSPVALRRATRNFETLQTLHRSGLPTHIKACVPQAVAGGSHAGFEFRVETCLDGRAGLPQRAEQRRASEWPPEAVAYIVGLHTATKRAVMIDADLLRSRVNEPIAIIARVCATPEAQDVLRRTQAACLRALGGQTLPLVQTHGDFTESNCLSDSLGRLTGVVDWELAETQGFPLLDLLQLMPVAGETDSAARWQRFDAWLELWRERSRAAADPVLGDYLRRFGLSADVVRGLILLQWITHIADRIDARGGDDRWMRLRVWQPMETLRRTLL
jgi:aminoglycoside phosphotransferase (APT) family kinase protein